MKKLLSLLMTLALLLSLAPSALAADPTFTLMVYLCGTDLESQSGMATADLREMIASGVKENGDLTVLVQTGGTSSWQVNGLGDREVNRWTLDEAGVANADSVGRANMGDQQTLADFLRYGLQNHPADRYGLILWDHGAGATGGVCYDEISGDALYYPELYGALSAASKEQNYRKFAFIGFDACLMAAYETAAHLSPFADYMLASEELEPGTGWDYTGWLPALADDPGMDIEELGKLAVDSFVSATLSYDRSDYATLSLCDLRKLGALTQAVEGMGASLSGEIDAGNFPTISRMRQNMRSFGETQDSASDMIDLGVFAEVFGRFDSDGAQAVRDALADVVVYERHTQNLSNCSGLSILVPFDTRNTADSYLPYYDQENLLPEYGRFVNGMLSGASGAGGDYLGTPSVSQQSIQAAQIDWFSQYADDQDSYQQGADSLWGEMYGGDYGQDNASDFSLDSFLNELFTSGDSGYNADYDSGAYSLWGDLGADTDTSFATDSGYGGGAPSLWGDLTPADESTVSIQTGAGEDVQLDNPFAGTQSDYAYTVELTQEQLQYLGKVEANLMMDVSDPDFECYVELGYVEDVVVDWNRGKIYGMFDGTWATLDGQMVCLYDQIANERYIRSLIPATVNGVDTYLLVVFDEDNPGGAVIGYTEGYTDSGMPARGYDKLSPGDIVVPMYELLYWDENGEQQSEPFEGDPITVGAGGSIPFGYEPVEPDANYTYSFCLTDVYGDYTFTDMMTVAF